MRLQRARDRAGRQTEGGRVEWLDGLPAGDPEPTAFQLPGRIVGVLLRQRGEVRAPFEPGMEPVDQHFRVEARTRLWAGDEDLADLASCRQTRLVQVLGTGIAPERA